MTHDPYYHWLGRDAADAAREEAERQQRRIDQEREAAYQMRQLQEDNPE